MNIHIKARIAVLIVLIVLILSQFACVGGGGEWNDKCKCTCFNTACTINSLNSKP